MTRETDPTGSTENVNDRSHHDGPTTDLTGQQSRRRCCYLSSGLSPSAQEFRLVHRPLDAVGSRTLTAGSGLHRSRSTCFQYATADVSPLHTTSETGVRPTATARSTQSVALPLPGPDPCR